MHCIEIYFLIRAQILIQNRIEEHNMESNQFFQNEFKPNETM